MNWLYTLWFGYVWASLKGNGPEAVVQTIVYAGLAYFFYPPFRKWVTKEEREASALLHEKLDHVIRHHPDIPPFKPKDKP